MPVHDGEQALRPASLQQVQQDYKSFQACGQHRRKHRRSPQSPRHADSKTEIDMYARVTSG